MRSNACVCAAVIVCLASIPARADELGIEMLDGGPWAAAVAALQGDRASEGRRVQVVVLDSTGARADCGRYQLTLDEPGQQAFRVEECDPPSRATAIRLIARRALFAHDSFVPRPLPIGIAATEIRTGGTAGGAALTGGSALECSVTVEAYLDDLERGTHVALGPDSYEIRSAAAGLQIETADRGWTLRSATRATLFIEYDVIDRASGEVALHDHATLTCGSGPDLPAQPAPAVPPALRLDPGLEVGLWASGIGALVFGVLTGIFGAAATTTHSSLVANCGVDRLCGDDSFSSLHTETALTDISLASTLVHAAIFFVALGLFADAAGARGLRAALDPTELRF